MSRIEIVQRPIARVVIQSPTGQRIVVSPSGPPGPAGPSGIHIGPEPPDDPVLFPLWVDTN